MNILIGQEEGLPNITGTWNADDYYGGTSGAVYTTGVGWHYFKSGSGGGGQAYGINASRSSAIYGASDHVTPENFTARIWKRVN